MTDSFIKDPNSVETFTVVWCAKSNLNDGSASDTGALQGATLSTAAASVPTGLTLGSENTNATTIHGTSYDVNTVHNIPLSSGTAGTEYDVISHVTTSDGRTLDKTITIVCREK